MMPNIISQARHYIYRKDPYLGMAIQHISILPNDNIDTAATDGEIIYYSPSFIASLELTDVIFLLLHELLHIVLEHIERRKDRNHTLFNIAADIVVNGILIRNGMIPSSKLGQIVTGCQYQIHDNQTVESIYDQLPFSSQIAIANHNLWSISKNLKHSRIDFKQSPILRDVNLCEVKTHVNYRQLLMPYIELEDYDYSYNRYKEYVKPYLLPSFRKEVEVLSNIWVLIDVSGSMKSRQINQMMGQLKDLIHQYSKVNIYLSYFSLDVSKPVLLQDINDLEFLSKRTSSKLGTDFHVIFKKTNDFFKEKPKAALIFTDGYAPFPTVIETEKIQTFWMMSTRIQSPIGKTIYIGDR